MKQKFFFLVACLFAILAGCKKDNDMEVTGPLSAQIDGDLKTFNSAPKGILVSNVSPYQLKITGNERPGSMALIEITIVSPTPIVAGTYTNNIASGMSVRIVYVTDALFFGIHHDSWEQVGSLQRNGTVTISEIKNSSVKGTFDATLFYTDIAGSSGINNLSGGVFNVNF